MNETQKLEAIEDIERLTLDRQSVKTINWQKRYEKLKETLSGHCYACVDRQNDCLIYNCLKGENYRFDIEKFEGGKR